MSAHQRDANFSLAACEHCGQHIEFPSEGIGARIACPACNRETVLSPIEEQPAIQAAEISASELQTAFNGNAVPARISIFYQLGLLLVALFMVLLPLAYLALIAALAWGVYWYAVHGLALFSFGTVNFRLNLIRGVLYAGPLIGGAIAVFFMFKPLLARGPRRPQPLELNPAVHPRAYQFIAHISDLLRVPMPKSIELDADLNASAGFRRGWLSLFGRDLVLCLGLPLVAGMNTRQLAGVVAHELGHCTQGLAMRLSFIIESVNRWFLRVIYQRDAWDEALDQWSSEAESGAVTAIVVCAQICVGLSRGILKILMFSGHAVMCFLSRQMEYHADACSAGICGSAGVESLLIRLRELGLLNEIAYNRIGFCWEQRHQLPSSLPEFLERLEERAPAGFREKATETLLNETAGVFATHPTPAERIRKARQQGKPGVFEMEKPSRLLFGDFDKLSQTVTRRHYLHSFGLAVPASALVPASDFLK